jgi:hypothetical protein
VPSVPLSVRVVEKDMLPDTLRQYRDRGYRCVADDDGDWECVKPINELLADRHLIVVKP